MGFIFSVDLLLFLVYSLNPTFSLFLCVVFCCLSSSFSPSWSACSIAVLHVGCCLMASLSLFLSVFSFGSAVKSVVGAFKRDRGLGFSVSFFFFGFSFFFPPCPLPTPS